MRPPPFEHVGQDMVGERDRHLEVDADDGAKIVGILLGDLTDDLDAGVVDEDVDRSVVNASSMTRSATVGSLRSPTIGTMSSSSTAAAIDASLRPSR